MCRTLLPGKRQGVLEAQQQQQQLISGLPKTCNTATSPCPVSASFAVCRWEDFPSINEQNLTQVEGYWICKSSWGTRWGLGGNVKIAYGAAGVIEPYPAYGLQFGPNVPDIKSTISTMQQGLSYDSRPGCIAFTPRQPMRLIKLVADVWTFLLETNSASVDERIILGEVVASNLALTPLFAMSKGPFRMCGFTAEMVAKAVGMQPPEVSGGTVVVCFCANAHVQQHSCYLLCKQRLSILVIDMHTVCDCD
jgi:hypothetical protein